MHRKPFFWIGHLALAGLVSFGAAPVSEAQAQSTATKKPAATKSSSAKAKKPVRRTSAARRAAAARAAAEAAAMPRYKVDESGDVVPDLRAAAAIIYSPATGEVLWEENSQDQRSIASITKVMTAAVFLESAPEEPQPVTIVTSDVSRASTTFLRRGDRVTTDDLLHLLLIASDNAAARALARVSPHGSAGFIERMNDKALELGLDSTHYADPSGLLSANVSSAFDMARLIAFASSDERISAIMRKPDHTLRTQKRTITFRSTNHLLKQEEFDVMGGKTGFITKAGYCLATLLRLPQSGQEVAVVVLGARSNAARFLETQNLFNWLSNQASSFFATSTGAPE